MTLNNIFMTKIANNAMYTQKDVVADVHTTK